MSADTNKLGLTKQDYIGAKSTLCFGCGHDSVTASIITALFQSHVNPYYLAKMSGIGCSSKTPAYFMSRAHGFNALHGRMAPVATGAKIANHRLQMLGISGDGDTASIGLGGFAHMIRRNLPIVYIIENNGVYGLTKGQFSATADEGTRHKGGEANPFDGIDLCAMAIDLGCTFVARSFSGDGKQLVPLIQAALRHNGTAVLDVISPCITFANHEGSTKSFQAVRATAQALHALGFIEPQAEITVDYPEGTSARVTLPDGSVLTLTKLRREEHRLDAAAETLKLLHDARSAGEVVTGLLHYQDQQPTLLDRLNMVDEPLAHLDAPSSRPSCEAFDALMKPFC